jgi:hypothetical protein
MGVGGSVLSRRLLIIACAAGGGGNAAAQVPVKMSQAAAQYQDHPRGGLSCIGCTFFRRPRSCKVVGATSVRTAGAGCSICRTDGERRTSYHCEERSDEATSCLTSRPASSGRGSLISQGTRGCLRRAARQAARSYRTTRWVVCTRRSTASEPPIAAATAPRRRTPKAAKEVFEAAAALASAAFLAV